MANAMAASNPSRAQAGPGGPGRGGQRAGGQHDGCGRDEGRPQRLQAAAEDQRAQRSRECHAGGLDALGPAPAGVGVGDEEGTRAVEDPLAGFTQRCADDDRGV